MAGHFASATAQEAPVAFLTKPNLCVQNKESSWLFPNKPFSPVFLSGYIAALPKFKPKLSTNCVRDSLANRFPS